MIDENIARWINGNERRVQRREKERGRERIFIDRRIFFFVVINLCSRRFKILINILCRT